MKDNHDQNASQNRKPKQDKENKRQKLPLWITLQNKDAGNYSIQVFCIFQRRPLIVVNALRSQDGTQESYQNTTYR
jgi:hypothetical protein